MILKDEVRPPILSTTARRPFRAISRRSISRMWPTSSTVCGHKPRLIASQLKPPRQKFGR
jgi:hypothetical protein